MKFLRHSIHFSMVRRCAERMYLWMLWKRKLLVQYWMRFESTRVRQPRERELKLSSTLQTKQHTCTDYSIRSCVRLPMCVCMYLNTCTKQHLNNNLNWNIRTKIERTVHYNSQYPPLRVCFHWLNKFYTSSVRERCRLINSYHLCHHSDKYESEHLFLILCRYK